MPGFYEFIRSEEGLPLKVFLHSVNRIQMHWHNELEILFILKGSIELRIGSELYLLKENDLILINSKEVHNTSRTQEENIVLALQINPEYYDRLYPKFSNMYFKCNSLVAGEKEEEAFGILRSFLAKIAWETNKKREGYKLIIGSQLNLLGAYLVNRFDYHLIEDVKTIATDNDIYRLEKIVTYINENIEQKITLKEIASREHISPYYLSHFFKGKMGISFQEYINIIRLDKATSLLITTNETITDIALKCGFSSTNYFNKLFKENYNLTPTEYREKNFIESSINEKMDKDKVKSKTYLDVDRTHALEKLFTHLDPKFGLKDNYLTGVNRQMISVALNEEEIFTYKPYWKKLTTMGRAAEGLRANVQKQLRELQDEIGFEYIRFHGIFTDEMMIYNLDKEGNISYNWTYVDELFDFFMEVGIKPFVELGFMPSELKRSDETIFWWKGNISPPKDIRLWTDLVKEFIKHCINRYGLEEVSLWYFEVWNEPEFQYVFWAGSKEEYFEFFRETVLSIKSISKELKVGGPAVTHGSVIGSNWLEDFLIYCDTNRISLDFVSIHIYPEYIPIEKIEEIYDDFINNKVVPDVAEIKKVYHDKDHTFNIISQVRDKINSILNRKPELHITEWNASSSLGNLIHDTSYVSTFIVKNVLQNINKADSLGYWVFTDIFEEEKLKSPHFHGGFGLINKDGLKKASYYGYYLLNKLGEEIVKQGDDYIITKNDNNFQILMYNYAYFDQLFSKGDTSALTNKKRYEIYEVIPEKQIGINLKGLFGNYKITRYQLNREHGSVFDQWLKIGAPENMTKEEIGYLQGVSKPKITIEYREIKGEFIEKSYIPVHGIELITIEKKI